jgi:3-hydroxypropionyl-CoA synthetase (ADP-forming)
MDKFAMAHTLDDKILKPIEAVIADAYAQGRNVLFEHEVYAILSKLGLNTPNHFMVRNEKEITDNLLYRFGSEKIVLKIVAPDLTHKQEAGGVQMVNKDLEFVKYTYNRMKSEFSAMNKKIEGLLFVEFIDYSQDLGNENLLGFRESEAFGPVISFSKGGLDAEHFAQYYSPPNLILAPIDRQWAQALLESTHIQKKYAAQGKTGYISKIVDAGVKFSALSVSFSNFFFADTQFVISEFEINPFVFTPDGNFIAIDGFARFEKRKGQPVDLEIAPSETMTPFFEPDGIAVVGASTTDSRKMGNLILKNLINLKRNDVYCVNIKGGLLEVADKQLKVYKSLNDIDKWVDLVIISVPVEAVLAAVKDCARKEVKAVIIIPGGFSEVDRHRNLEDEILSIAKSGGFRIMGPNCLGLVYSGSNRTKGVNSFFTLEEKFAVDMKNDSNVAILSQSGALGIVEIENLKNAISPKVIVSYGNQLDVDPCDLVNFFQSDPMVDVIGCYIEGFKPNSGRKFFNIAARSKKPIIVYKAGRTEAGRKATESHTASIAGEYAVAKAAMKQAGIIVADSMMDHGDFIKTFALLNDFSVTGKRVAIIANAGYEKAYAADNLGDLQLAEFDEETTLTLKNILPPMVNVGPLLDLTPMANDEMFEKCMRTVLESGTVDALFVSIVPHSSLLQTTDNEIDKNKDNIAARIVKVVHQYKKPTAVSVNVASGIDAIYNKLGQTLDAGGVPAFLSAKRAMRCLNAFIHYHLMRKSGSFSEWLK